MGSLDYLINGFFILAKVVRIFYAGKFRELNLLIKELNLISLSKWLKSGL